MKIGFYGDSYCQIYGHDKHNNILYDTYIKKIADHYGIQKEEIVNYGLGGSSVWDTIILQYGLINDNRNIPDVLIFVWTDHMRLYNRHIRSLNTASIIKGNERFLVRGNNVTGSQIADILNASREYYMHIIDPFKEELSYVSVLKYFDKEVLSKIADKCKIIHMWSFFKPSPKTYHLEEKQLKLTDENYYFRWKNGMEIRPTLLELSMYGLDPTKTVLEKMTNDTRSNHIEGEYKNSLLANTIINAIDNYETGKLIKYNLE